MLGGGTSTSRPPGFGLSLLHFLWLNLSSWQACPLKASAETKQLGQKL